jgi:hypothetical protein
MTQPNEREEHLRKLINNLAAECDRQFDSNILATVLQGAPLTELLEPELEQVLNNLVEEFQRNLAVKRS